MTGPRRDFSHRFSKYIGNNILIRHEWVCQSPGFVMILTWNSQQSYKFWSRLMIVTWVHWWMIPIASMMFVWSLSAPVSLLLAFSYSIQVISLGCRFSCLSADFLLTPRHSSVHHGTGGQREWPVLRGIAEFAAKWILDVKWSTASCTDIKFSIGICTCARLW